DISNAPLATPVYTVSNFNSLLRPNDPTSEIKVEPGGAMEHGFALEATVLRVGTAPPTAGTIDATSIITLTIL
ncbi:fimbrial protein, partial [Burkholderia pseudomallei]